MMFIGGPVPEASYSIVLSVVPANDYDKFNFRLCYTTLVLV